MAQKTIFAVLIAGGDITEKLSDFVQSITISDKAGTSADTATLLLDDSAGVLNFPPYNAPITILLGFRGSGVSIAFVGTVDEVRHSGGRGGTNITVTAKGVDTSGKAKEPQQRHFDGMTIEAMLIAAGAFSGINDVRVDHELAAISRAYEHMDDESFMAFGERLAKEVGGTFKMRNGIAVMAKKNSGRTPKGDPLPQVIAKYADNLHTWDVAPYIGRPRYKQIRVRFYDTQKACHDEVIVETGIEGSDAIAVGTFRAHNRAAAQEKANSLKAESERGSGVGSISIEGNVGAQPEANCLLIGARAGIDGTYVIDGVDHTYSRRSGFITKLQLAYPVGTEGEGYQG